jgi:hypothetical protein
MRRWLGLSASTVLGLTLAGSVAVWAQAPFQDSAQMLGLFRKVSIPAIPTATYFGTLLWDYGSTRAGDQVAVPRLVLEAHVLGLGLAGLLHVLALSAAWMVSTVRWDFFATAVAASVAGGSGLAWGALGCLLDTV